MGKCILADVGGHLPGEGPTKVAVVSTLPVKVIAFSAILPSEHRSEQDRNFYLLHKFLVNARKV